MPGRQRATRRASSKGGGGERLRAHRVAKPDARERMHAREQPVGDEPEHVAVRGVVPRRAVGLLGRRPPRRRRRCSCRSRCVPPPTSARTQPSAARRTRRCAPRSEQRPPTGRSGPGKSAPFSHAASARARSRTFASAVSPSRRSPFAETVERASTGTRRSTNDALVVLAEARVEAADARDRRDDASRSHERERRVASKHHSSAGVPVSSAHAKRVARPTASSASSPASARGRRAGAPRWLTTLRAPARAAWRPRPARTTRSRWRSVLGSALARRLQANEVRRHPGDERERDDRDDREPGRHLARRDRRSARRARSVSVRGRAGSASPRRARSARLAASPRPECRVSPERATRDGRPLRRVRHARRERRGVARATVARRDAPRRDARARRGVATAAPEQREPLDHLARRGRPVVGLLLEHREERAARRRAAGPRAPRRRAAGGVGGALQVQELARRRPTWNGGSPAEHLVEDEAERSRGRSARRWCARRSARGSCTGACRCSACWSRACPRAPWRCRSP